jgi:hypothetical protein
MTCFISWLNSSIEWLDTHAGAITSIATGVIAWFTISLVEVSRRQAELFGDQIKLAREEFLTTHTPTIVMRNPSVCAGTINYSLVNFGGAVATLKECRIILKSVPKGFAAKTLQCEVHSDLGEITFDVEESKEFAIEASARTKEKEEHEKEIAEFASGPYRINRGEG